jgi:hypothetical protein
MESSTQAYETHDLVLASFLVCRGNTCRVVPTSVPNRAAFCFDRTDKLDSDLAAFASGEGRVSPSSYEYIRRDLLDRVRTILRQEGGWRDV